MNNLSRLVIDGLLLVLFLGLLALPMSSIGLSGFQNPGDGGILGTQTSINDESPLDYYNQIRYYEIISAPDASQTTQSTTPEVLYEDLDEEVLE
jgi:hypothetical protein